MPGLLQSALPVEDLAIGARFLWKVPRFLRSRGNLDLARATLRRRLEQRDADFLALADRAIFQHPPSPYRRLFDLAGCEFGDLSTLVRRDGLDDALRTLYRRGVYLTADELKGRRPVVRGSQEFAVNPEAFHNPLAAVDVLRYRSGSRGGRAPIPVDLASVRDRSVNIALSLAARGGIGWQHAWWEIPGGIAIVHMLECQGLDAPPVRWFSQVDPAAPGLHPRYRWSARLLGWVGALSGVSLPRPQYVPLENPLPIARWMQEVLSVGKTPHLTSYASTAVRVAQAAIATGIDLRGAQFTVSGEPVTRARLSAITRTGAVAVPRCGTSEAGVLGYGCLAPEAADDLHIFNDLNAVIQAGLPEDPTPVPPAGLLITSLRRTARLILVNVSLGDQATMTTRACGCSLDAAGWTTHMHTLRSYEKVNTGGMTFPDADLIHVLEEVLPARFGGGPIDYQLTEAESADGTPCVRLLVNPAVGPLDEAAVADTFLNAIGRGSGVERVMALQWRALGLPRVERRAPEATGVGKVLHLYQRPGLAPSGSQHSRDSAERPTAPAPM